MGKQGRKNGVFKDGTAYSKGDKPKDDVHEVDLSRLTIEHCDGCKEGHLTAPEIMEKRNYLGGSIHKYWYPTELKHCCLSRTPYRVFTAADLASDKVPQSSITCEKVLQIFATLEAKNAQRQFDLMARFRCKEDLQEMGRSMIRRTKEKYAGVKLAKRPPELIARIKRELVILDDDLLCPSKARLLFRCVDGNVCFTLDLMMQTKQAASEAAPRPTLFESYNGQEYGLSFEQVLGHEISLVANQGPCAPCASPERE